jgi:hypothetical protein
MKKVLLALMVTVFSSAVFAQGNINKGDWMVGGSATFTSQKYKGFEGTSSSFEISPDAGYFFANQFAGGLSLSFQSTKETGSDAISAIAVAPFLRYYFLPAEQKVNLFAQGSYALGSTKSGGESASISGYSFSAGPSIFLTPATALEIGLNYSSLGGEAFTGTRLNTFGVKVGFQIHLPGSGTSK